MKHYFRKAGVLLTDLLHLDRSGKGTSKLNQELISLSGGRRGFVKEYYAEKVSMVLAVLTAGIVLATVCGISFQINSRETVIEELKRPDYGEGDRTERLQVQFAGEETARELEVKVRERSYTEQEKEVLLNKALEQLETMITGKNKSLDEVRCDLVLPQSLEDGAVEISWVTVPYGVVDTNGRLTGAQEESGTLVELRATLSCGKREAVYTVYANVFPPELDDETRLQDSIRREADLADIRDNHEESVKLPKELNGKALIWSRSLQNPFFQILALTVTAAVCLYIQRDSRIHDQAEARKQQLLLDYPDLMWKMTMLLGAGLSIRGTFVRISEEYTREKENRRKSQENRRRSKAGAVRYVYEEVVYACMEMQSGISEAHAYERFGKRCQLPEYIRLGTVLSQNLRKGSNGLIAMLEAEAAASLADRRNYAKQIGEKAGTKLLLPMVLMLGVVLAVLMVPALLSF